MFNVYQYDKKQDEADKNKIKEERYLFYKTKSIAANALRKSNYKERVGKFITDVIQNPTVVEDALGTKLNHSASAMSVTHHGRYSSFNPQSSQISFVRGNGRLVEGFLVNQSMATLGGDNDSFDHLKVVQQITGQAHKSKKFDAALRNNKGMRFRASQRQRITDAQRDHSMLESSPTKMHEGSTHEKIMNLRPRVPSKELAGEFRYKAKSNAEKVIDSYHKNYPLSSFGGEDAFSSHMMQKGLKGIIKQNIECAHKPRAKNNTSSTSVAANTVGPNTEEKLPSRTHQHSRTASKLITPMAKVQVKANHLFPHFHNKTFFKAAMEYSIGQQLSARTSIQDTIDKQILQQGLRVQEADVNQPDHLFHISSKPHTKQSMRQFKSIDVGPSFGINPYQIKLQNYGDETNPYPKKIDPSFGRTDFTQAGNLKDTIQMFNEEVNIRLRKNDSIKVSKMHSRRHLQCDNGDQSSYSATRNNLALKPNDKVSSTQKTTNRASSTSSPLTNYRQSQKSREMTTIQLEETRTQSKQSKKASSTSYKAFTKHTAMPFQTLPVSRYQRSPRNASQSKSAEKMTGNPYNITFKALRKCNIIRAKNISVQPLQQGKGLERINQSGKEMRNVRNLFAKVNVKPLNLTKLLKKSSLNQYN